jgi:FixJ family two-component response regulator
MNAGEIVYLIDDDCGVRHSVSALLESAHMSVVAFDSAASFLQQSRADDASCILLDLQLPGISGLDLQSKLTEKNSPPVIFISGRSDVPSTVRAMKAGAMEFLVKPVPSDVLLAAVRAAIAKDKLLREERAELARLRHRYSLLSLRERNVLPLVVSGLMNKQSAAMLGIAEVTLQVHRRQIMSKMEADSLADLVRMAARLDIPITPRALIRAFRR